MKKNLVAISVKIGAILIERDKILYCLSAGSYAQVHLSDGQEITVTKNLKEIEIILADDRFFRIHHARLINLNHAIHYSLQGNQYWVEMSNNIKLPIARNRKRSFLDLFSKI